MDQQELLEKINSIVERAIIHPHCNSNADEICHVIDNVIYYFPDKIERLSRIINTNSVQALVCYTDFHNDDNSYSVYWNIFDRTLKISYTSSVDYETCETKTYSCTFEAPILSNKKSAAQS